MTRPTDIDAVLASWLAQGAEQAPERHLVQALNRIATTPQRRVRPWSVQWRENPVGLLAFGAAVTVLVVALGVALQSEFVGGPDEPPPLSPGPLPSASAGAAPEPSAALQSSVELELFINRAEGYELLLPAIWAPTEVERGDSQTATAFGSGAGFGTRSAPALTIIVGETDGSITPCTCPRTKVSSLDDLEELVVSTPSFFHTGPPEQHSELTLDGEQARSESAGIGNNCLGCPDAFFHVYAIHDGRPFVLAFDYWTVRFRTISTPEIDLNFSPQTLDTILNSFRFLEPAAVEQPDVVDGVRTFVSSDGSFQLELPQDWRLDRGTDWTALYLNRGVTQLSVRAGDDRGSILTNLRARGRNA